MSIHPLDSFEGGVIVKVNPPNVSADEELSHVPCDITLVIDVSASMDDPAPMPRDPTEPHDPSDANRETVGLSVLDLVKHSCRTILSSMDHRDRLAIVKFSHSAKVLQGLEFTTHDNKKKALANIEALGTEGMTNLWHALKTGIHVFRDAEPVGNVPAIMVLTDGLPNHMCPPQGYVPALSALGPIVPAIHTFGFGYKLRSGLLKSIAEFGGGHYAFIPDAGMIGTTFVHAVANLQSIFVIDACLRLTCSKTIVLEETTGPYVKKGQAAGPAKQQRPNPSVKGDYFHLTIPLGNIQYGQSRDIHLRVKTSDPNRLAPEGPYRLEVSLEFTPLEPGERGTTTRVTRTVRRSLADISSPPPAQDVAYHVSRARICAFLAGLFPVDEAGEHRVDKALSPVNNYDGPTPTTSAPGLKAKQDELARLVAFLPAAQYPEDARCRSLWQDLAGDEPFGQVTLALATQGAFDRWGQHYLLSLHDAHAGQRCNNFKDPGPLQYGAESPLFLRCRDELDKAFNDLPPPPPSLSTLPFMSQGPVRAPPGDAHLINDPPYRMFRGGTPPPAYGSRGASPPQDSPTLSSSLGFSMVSYNMSANVCFAGPTLVALASGHKTRLRDLKKGMRVATPLGPRSVAAVLTTPVRGQWMVQLAGVLVTPWHPVNTTTTTNVATGWQFPCLVAGHRMMQYTGHIYSVLLQRDDNVDAHALLLGGDTRITTTTTQDAETAPFWGVTLGHGLVAGLDVRAHGFFGDYTRVARSLAGLAPARARGGDDDRCLLTGGVRRSKMTGLACGFKKAKAAPGPLMKHNKASSSPITGRKAVMMTGLVRLKRMKKTTVGGRRGATYLISG